MASAAILFGGQATRFGGRDKSTLRLDDRTILDCQLDALRDLTDDILFVGGPVHRSHPGGRTVLDRVPGCGPLAGLDAALAEARDDQLLLLACDMPCVTTALLAYLLGLATEADAVVPRTERGYHPLCAVYSRACHEAVRRRLAKGQLTMQALLDDVRVRIVGRVEISQFGESDHLLANVNTQAEWDGLRVLLGHTH